MTALVRAELLRLRSARSTWALLGGAVALSVLLMALVLGGAGTIDGAAAGSQEQRRLVVGAGAPAALLLAAVFGVLLVTGELASRTLTASLLITPDRRRIVLAKVVAGAAAGAAVAACLLALGVAAATAAGSGPDGGLVRQLAGTVLMAAGTGVIGVGIGTVVRHQTAALAVPVLWLLGVEPLLSGFDLTWLRPWLPGGALAAMSGMRFAGALPLVVAGCVVAAYAAALLVPGTRSLLRRDVV
jgi:ABC-2 type transport system permease protein